MSEPRADETAESGEDRHDSEPSLLLLDLTDQGLLPLGVHISTLDEIERVFVNGAPFEQERRILMEALRLYAKLVWRRFPDARLWINGGFVTMKEWAPPKDADVVVLVPNSGNYDPAAHPEDLPLWTLREVSVGRPSVSAVARVQPMGGLIDGFYVNADMPATVAMWRGFWQRLTRPGEADVLDAKGFVEVRNS